jgi:hypothetical protein
MKNKPKSSFSRWNALLRQPGNKSGKVTSTIPARIKRFPFLKKIDGKEIGITINLLSQGRALLKAAAKEPLGYETSGEKTLTPTRKTRMIQWRFVMAFGGLETMGKALVLPRQNSWGKPYFGTFATQMAECMEIDNQFPLESLPIPGATTKGQKRKNLTREKFFAETNLGDGGEMAKALNLNPHDVKMLGDWATGNLPLNRWAERLDLAKTLRNCTVHGALSANRAYKLGFNNAFRELTTNLETFAESIFAHLVKPNA